jgi:hypothetical protein
MLYFHLMEENAKDKKKEREITMMEEGFPEAGLTLLAVPQVAVVKCN